jgi:hypothetical protein
MRLERYMKWGRLVVLLGVITLWPGTAFAAAGWWAWLEELSGPGPFRGLVIAAPVLCFRDGKVVSCFLPVPKNATEEEAAKYRPKRLLFVSVGSLGSSDHLRFKDLPDTPENRREVNVLQVSGTYVYRLHPAVDVGFGAGTMRFSGEGFRSLWRFTLIPATASVRPFALVKQWQDNRWAQVVRGEIETSFVTSGFTAAQFGNSASTFSTGAEFLTRAAVVIDFGALVWGRH